jgi:hypothetical protein
VREGNAAANQLQLDIYGELIDAVYLYDKWYQPIPSDYWEALHAVVDWLCDHWDQPDEGIWETRGGRKNFVYSRLMSWGDRTGDADCYSAGTAGRAGAQAGGSGCDLSGHHGTRLVEPAAGLRPV